MASTQVTYVLNLRDKASAKLKNVNKNVNKTNKAFAGLGRTIIGFGAGALALKGLKDGLQTMTKFEQVASNLSAITGQTGEGLDFLKQKAIELGGASTKSSVEALEAFKLIASAKPELLDNAQALAATTKEAVALSEASGLDLPEAAKALTSALNQFGLAADQSSRVINVLAAGSKFAAAEIPELATSLEEFGGVAESLGISLEESAAAVETLSAKNLKGARAGIQMRNVLLKLGASTDKNINPKIVGLSKALENLAGDQDNITKLTKMFGRQNVLAAQTLIKQRERFDELTQSMTGTNIAYEQQRINVDNLAGDMAGMSSAWEKFILNLNKGDGMITQMFRNFAQNVTKMLNWLDDLNTKATVLGSRAADALLEQGLINPDDKLEDQIADAKAELESYNIILDRTKGRLDKLNREPFFTFKKGRRKEFETDIAKYQKLIESLQSFIKDPTGFKLAPEATEFVEGLGDPIAEDGATGKLINTITGAAPKTFNINIDSLIEVFNVNTENITEGATEVKRQITMALSEALADVQPVTD